MPTFLRQSTQIVVRIGPAVAVGDGFTPVTSLDLSAADEAELLKAAGAATVSLAAATFAAISGADGWYDLTLTTSHTDTVGELVVVVNDDSLILPIYQRFQVVEEAIYDALFAGSANAFSGAAGSTTLTALASGSITAAVIATGAIDADAIADNAIDAGALAADCITAAKIANGAIDAATFAADVDAEILSYIVDDATRIDASALNTATGTSIPAILADTGTDGVVVNTFTTAGKAEIQTEANDALVANNLDHLVGTATGIPSIPAGTFLDQIMDDGTATFDRTTDSLQALRDRGDAAWTTATGFSTHSAADVWSVGTRVLTAGTNIQLPSNGLANVTAWTVAITGNVTGNLSGSVGSVTGNVGGNVTGSVGSLATQAKADVNAEVDSAIETYHLDHLLAADYDPASKPGVSTALLNELIESDAGVSRFTANALEQAPSGGGSLTAQQVWEYATRTLTALDEDSTTLDLDATIRAAVGLASANLDTQLSQIDSVVDAILLDTGTTGVVVSGSITTLDALYLSLYTARADFGPTASAIRTAVGLASANLDTQLDAIPTAAEVWSAGTRTLTANTNLNDPTAAAIATSVLTTAMTESYAVNGAAPTLAQAMFAVHQYLMTFGISGTSYTVKKLDGSTTAFVVQLNDATTPTAATRS